MSSNRRPLLAALMVIQAFAAFDALAETRTLSLFFGHTQQSLVVTYKRDGQFDQEALAKLNAFLRDWRREKETKMDPRLFDVLWQVHQETGARGPIHIVSAYRSPETNETLRSRGRGVAQFSQHTLGKAIDFYIPDVPLAKIREVGLRLQAGGVGFYPTSGSPFVHVDVGGVRHWPRMSREQLARLFPDGRTLHIPSDGQPLEGYQLAAADQARRSGAPAAEPRSGRNFFSFLFGGKDQSEDDEQAAAPTPAPVAARPAPRPAAPTPVQTAQVAPADARARAAAVPPPAPRPPDAPRPGAAQTPDAMMDALVARQRRESAARAAALSSLAPAEPAPAPARRGSPRVEAPQILTNLAPLGASNGAAPSAALTFDKNDPAIRSAAGSVSRNPDLFVQNENSKDLYGVPGSLVVLSFTRGSTVPAPSQRFEGPAIVALPIRVLGAR